MAKAECETEKQGLASTESLCHGEPGNKAGGWMLATRPRTFTATSGRLQFIEEAVGSCRRPLNKLETDMNIVAVQRKANQQ